MADQEDLGVDGGNGDLKETQSDMLARHKKEIKALEGSKRAAIKKAKGLKGKKGKEALEEAEREFGKKEKELAERQKKEISRHAETGEQSVKEESQSTVRKTEPEPVAESEADKAAKRREKAAKKKQKQRDAERQRQKEIEEETANAGPSMRDIEKNKMIELYLAPEGLQIVDIAADGHCLYRAIAFHMDGDANFKTVRSLCADKLTECSDEFSAFAEYDDSFENYVERVRSSAEWGGQLELQALAKALKRDIRVYSADATPLTISAGDSADNGEPIQLSYHKHYYALGEHYNVVVS